ncbi:hypothetical protein VTK26DRAFT_4505 [Humicola hyalothermophila]
MKERDLHRARLVSSVAATLIALSCGTNYVYSAWAPQFADKLHLTTTETNLIGLAGNLGMYSMGVPIGLFVDHRGPRPAVIAGSLLLGLGYFPFRAAYETGSGSVPVLCVLYFLTGLGSCMAFLAAVKTSALNWPHHRGTATAFPVAAFGLSAFFFSVSGSILFPGDTGAFLILLAVGTFSLTFLGFFFLKVYPPTSYHSLPTATGSDSLVHSQQLRRTLSQEDKAAAPRRGHGRRRSLDVEPDIRGWRLLRNADFWQMFAIMGILAGIGLMTINNIGHNVNALWKHYDGSVEEAFLVKRQQMHVSILSICSFTGRLLSGVGSDFLVKTMHASRAWCLVIACAVFCIAQLCAISIVNPNLTFFVSSLSGLGYGFLFGVFPSIVAESFGIHGLSQNWGLMTMSPVISGNIFNLFYGAVFDSHSVVLDDGERTCLDGVDCYRNAFFVTLIACGVGIAVTLSMIRNQYRRWLIQEGKGAAED